MPAKSSRLKEAQDKKRRTLLGNMIRNARERAKLTLSDVKASTYIHVSVPYLSDVERGNRNISPDNLGALLQLFRCSEDERVEIYQMARCLPPAVQTWTLGTPSAWGFDGGALRRVAQKIVDNPKIPADLRREAEKALTRFEW